MAVSAPLPASATAIHRAYRRAGVISAGWYGEDCVTSWRPSDLGHPTLNLLLEGAYEREVGGVRRTIDPSRRVWIDAPFRSRHLRPGRERGIYVQVARDVLEQALGDVPFTTDAPSPPGLLGRAWDALDFARSAAPPDAEERLLELLGEVLDGIGPPIRADRKVREAQARIALDPVTAPGPTALARELGLSRFALCRRFRAATGRSVLEYREDLRLVQAFERLRDPRCDLATLAVDLGYASHSHFTRRFRRRLGRTPTEVRART